MDSKRPPPDLSGDRDVPHVVVEGDFIRFIYRSGPSVGILYRALTPDLLTRMVRSLPPSLLQRPSLAPPLYPSVPDWNSPYYTGGGQPFSQPPPAYFSQLNSATVSYSRGGKGTMPPRENREVVLNQPPSVPQRFQTPTAEAAHNLSVARRLDETGMHIAGTYTDNPVFTPTSRSLRRFRTIEPPRRSTSEVEASSSGLPFSRFDYENPEFIQAIVNLGAAFREQGRSNAFRQLDMGNQQPGGSSTTQDDNIEKIAIDGDYMHFHFDDPNRRRDIPYRAVSPHILANFTRSEAPQFYQAALRLAGVQTSLQPYPGDAGDQAPPQSPRGMRTMLSMSSPSTPLPRLELEACLSTAEVEVVDPMTRPSIPSPAADVEVDQTRTRTTRKSSQASLAKARKRRNISSKSERLHIEEDDLELKVAWEEAQTLLRPPPNVKPSIVLVDGYEFEEYEEPPVFGKKTIFTARPFGGQDQWAQCDSCYKWRRLPSDVQLQSRWTCAENVWDPKRSSCAVPDEINSKELADIPRTNSESMKPSVADPPKETYTEEQTDLDALASAVLGDEENCNISSAARTRRHPRHRPGCKCIVCIQPSSGKGPKHEQTCTCNVCNIVRRRLTALRMAMKKKQMDKVTETGSKKVKWKKDESEVNSSVKRDELEQSQGNSSPENKLVIDLNCQPGREDELRERGGTSMINPVQVELNSLTCEQQDTAATASSSTLALPPTTVDGDGQVTEDNKPLADAAVEDGITDQS